MFGAVARMATDSIMWTLGNFWRMPIVGSAAVAARERPGSHHDNWTHSARLARSGATALKPKSASK